MLVFDSECSSLRLGKSLKYESRFALFVGFFKKTYKSYIGMTVLKTSLPRSEVYPVGRNDRTVAYRGITACIELAEIKKSDIMDKHYLNFRNN